jgi:hypothetical protein
MPMDFPDMESLKQAAEVWKFRQPNPDESEAEYRTALADHVQPRDLVESMEIRTSRGWDRLTPTEYRDTIRRSGMNAFLEK